MEAVPVWLGPERPEPLVAAIESGGVGRIADSADARAIVWWGDDPDGRPSSGVLASVLHDGIEWVQLDHAGVESWIDANALDQRRPYTNASGAFAGQVAEHAVALLLASTRRLAETARLTTWRAEVEGTPLAGQTVGLIGAGRIGGAIIARLQGFEVRIWTLTRTGRAIEGADRCLGAGSLHELLAGCDHVIACAPLTAATRGLLGAAELASIGPRGTLVNVGRGALVDTAALVAALRDGALGAAALDVTEPEPLPDGRPLFSLPGCLVTPHVANPPTLMPAGFPPERCSAMISAPPFDT